MKAKIIPDFYAAQRIGTAFVERNPDAIGFRVFQYRQSVSGLTLFGAAVKFLDSPEQEIRFQ